MSAYTKGVLREQEMLNGMFTIVAPHTPPSPAPSIVATVGKAANAARIVACWNFCAGENNTTQGLIDSTEFGGLTAVYAERNKALDHSAELASMVKRLIFAARDGAILPRDSIHAEALALVAKVAS